MKLWETTTNKIITTLVGAVVVAIIAWFTGHVSKTNEARVGVDVNAGVITEVDGEVEIVKEELSAHEELEQKLLSSVQEIAEQVKQVQMMDLTDAGTLDVSEHGADAYLQPNRMTRSGRLYKEGDKVCVTTYLKSVELGRSCEIVIQGSANLEGYRGRLSHRAAELVNALNLTEVYARIEPAQ